MNIYLKTSSTLFTKLTMLSLERRFLTMKITTVVQPVLQGDGSSNIASVFTNTTTIDNGLSG